ncbi:MAG: 2-C-methyl-D-erythritol 4-phosphate cytidylyltransferase [Chloroflexi bacterium]|nr:2-C-methyl-D-erythritol 4-phosphate cytidylyltransferase [Chloroflexota bacterium]
MTEPGVGRVAAIIVAAGASRRFGGDKLYHSLGARPLLAHTVDAFQRTPGIDRIVLVVSPAAVPAAERLIASSNWDTPVQVTTGGARRQDSVERWLALVDDCEWVAIHDGARPLVTPEIIARGIAVVREAGAAVAAVPVKDTIKRVSGTIVETLNRDTLWSAQTPQLFGTTLLRQAFVATVEDVTDDASLVERLGHPVKLFLGDYDNIKVTTAVDLLIAEAILLSRGEPR